MKSLLILFIILLAIFNINAQTDFLVWEQNIILENREKSIEIKNENEFNQFYIILEYDNFNSTQYSLNGQDWYPVTRNEHNDEIFISNLFFVEKGTQTVFIQSSEVNKARVIFQKLKQIQIAHPVEGSRAADCDHPPMVSQAEWRAGLPDPVPGRNGSKVNHLIIHHSAGDNGQADYVNVVRAYYLYHLQGNGWDDIGYNYLIDPFGVLYAGRDPLDSGIDQDNVIGAHLCSKNTNTMGVCVIGDFTDTIPSILARAKLIDLLSWKVLKDTIDIFGAAIHPQETGTPLDRIAGHRDGCNTECPGDEFYPLLHEIKLEVQAKTNNCLISSNVNLEEKEKYDWSISPNPFENHLMISSNAIHNNLKYSILDSHGHVINSIQLGSLSEKKIDFTQYPSGVYYLQLLSEEHSIVKKIIKL